MIDEVLETFHVKRTPELEKAIDDYQYGDLDYCIVDTRERGRIMYTHTNRMGVFKLGTDEVRRIFTIMCCNCLITCFPAKHYELHLELAQELNILYPDCVVATTNSWYPDKETIQVGID